MSIHFLRLRQDQRWQQQQQREVQPLLAHRALAQPAYFPPADLRGVNSDDFGSDGKESGVPSFGPTKNGHAVTEAVQKEIERRTANIDAESKKKEAQLKAAAESYMKGIIAQHEERLKEKKAEQMRLQKANEAKRNEYIKSGAVWSGVELMTDLSKANNYSKSTDRMRNILKKLVWRQRGRNRSIIAKVVKTTKKKKKKEKKKKKRVL
ncbi:hypothetical protein C4B63_207g1 [Trypanosoma cruzi]|uniref:Clathrin light chain n=1 Tax=Trypanosoma cruzi TaxID=5693 RepID=A0A2V2UQX4_TRYCR|nr:hypothetical protein C4B63_207g1 [Trypanosoma cruzi]